MTASAAGKPGLMPVAEALARITSGLTVLAAENVAVGDAVGRVLAAPVAARRNQPSADMSAMDGYAIRFADAPELPVSLKVIGESAAGNPFSGAIATGEAVRIFTGALVPDGADTVVIQENTTREGDVVTLVSHTAQGRNIRKAGFDFRTDAQLLPAARRLNARDIMLAAAGDHATLSVARRPRVGIIQTGDELVYPGQGTGSLADVVVSNVYGLAALARSVGAEVVDLGLVRDGMEETRAAIRQAEDMGIDVLVSSGGASVGEHDLMAPALKAEGVDLAVHKIALRPGKPLMFGTGRRMRALGLPGNPVSAYVCAVLFLLPILRRMQGEEVPLMPTRPAVLGAAMAANDMRMDFIRARLDFSDGLPRATPLPTQDSSMLSALALADCLLIRPSFAPAAEAGAPCEIIPFNG
ncbi:molybdopterin molybdenumtransferase MoeA [Azorhizobium oxalatiphilum]|uniref:Molybdopterin molybdenumtransferase n=1 Tax=Azorhizobium oxalatiphilum TaxID=980631 RepID=A0A917BUW9_9HYPH|nr:molybdopterin molybdotransferase MoeA [Azorhizobium oxalatiphilum]GGF59535.1 molybdopterin molybdenumtransferase MoeA [Azorhizobium oxalatiphilum]